MYMEERGAARVSLFREVAHPNFTPRGVLVCEDVAWRKCTPVPFPMNRLLSQSIVAISSQAFPCDRQCVLVVIALDLAKESSKPVEEKF